MRKPIGITLEESVLKEIDDIKGTHEPRSRYIEDIVIEHLKKGASACEQHKEAEARRLRQNNTARRGLAKLV